MEMNLFMKYAIETDQLTKNFAKTEALKGIHLQIPAGTIFGFLGPNGAGKTTTVRLLTGVLKPSGGQARVLGLDVALNQTEVRKRIGVLTETAGNYERLTAWDNLVIFGRLYGLDRGAAIKRTGEFAEIFRPGSEGRGAGGDLQHRYEEAPSPGAGFDSRAGGALFG